MNFTHLNCGHGSALPGGIVSDANSCKHIEGVAVDVDTPPKINIEPENDGFESFSFSRGVFSGSMLILWGVLWFDETAVGCGCFVRVFPDFFPRWWWQAIVGSPSRALA